LERDIKKLLGEIEKGNDWRERGARSSRYIDENETFDDVGNIWSKTRGEGDIHKKMFKPYWCYNFLIVCNCASCVTFADYSQPPNES